MREIKFRAWDKERKCMEGWDCLCRFNVESVFECDDLIMLQYTGFKDANGVEIWECSEINGRYKVVFKEPSYVLKDISNGDIVGFNEIKDRLTVTREYTEI